jgi:hypothetical protein
LSRPFPEILAQLKSPEILPEGATLLCGLILRAVLPSEFIYNPDTKSSEFLLR